MTVQIKLTPELESLVQKRIASGNYHSIEDVVCSALQLLEDYEEHRTDEVESLRKLIEEGLASGPARPFDGDSYLKRRFAS